MAQDIEEKRRVAREFMREYRKRYPNRLRKEQREYKRSRRKAGLDPYYNRILKDPKEKEKRVEFSKKYWDKNRVVLNEKSRSYTEKLTNNYVKRKLRQDGFSKESVNENPHLIELKKQILKIKRLAK